MGPLLWKVPCMEVPLCPRVRQEQGACRLGKEGYQFCCTSEGWDRKFL